MLYCVLLYMLIFFVTFHVIFFCFAWKFSGISRRIPGHFWKKYQEIDRGVHCRWQHHSNQPTSCRRRFASMTLFFCIGLIINIFLTILVKIWYFWPFFAFWLLFGCFRHFWVVLARIDRGVKITLMHQSCRRWFASMTLFFIQG